MKKAGRIIMNKYLLTGLLFAVWVAYFDRNDWFSQQERERELEEARENVAYLRAEIAGMKEQITGLKNDPAVLEKFARERYRLKKDNEDLYIFE